MARMTNKKRAERNKSLWSRANNSNRQKWETIQQQAYDFYLNDQLTSD